MPLVFFAGPIPNDSRQHRRRFAEQVTAVGVALYLRRDGFDPTLTIAATCHSAHHGHHAHPCTARIANTRLRAVRSAGSAHDTTGVANGTSATRASHAAHTNGATACITAQEATAA